MHKNANIGKKQLVKAVGRKISGGGATEKISRKIAPLNFPLLYQYHV